MLRREFAIIRTAMAVFILVVLDGARAQTTIPVPSPSITAALPVINPLLPSPNPLPPIAAGNVVAPGTFAHPLTNPALPVSVGGAVRGPGPGRGPLTDPTLPVAAALQLAPGQIRPPVDASKLPIATGRVVSSPATFPSGSITNPNLPIAQGTPAPITRSP